MPAEVCARQNGVEVAGGEWELFEVAVNKLGLRQPLAGDGQERVAGVETRDLAPKAGGEDRRPTTSASGVEEPHPRLDSQHRECVLPKRSAKRLLQFGPVTRSHAPQLALSFS